MDRKTILLVEDDPVMIDYMAGHLTPSFKLGVALNAKDMERYLKNDVPDLIILDIVLPDINGLDLCKIIKSNPSSAKTPIILNSGNSTAEQRAELTSCGADAFLNKPFDPEVLLALIHILLKGCCLQGCKIT